MHVLYDFPLPPSQNKQLTMAHGRLIKTQEARLFSEKVRIYGIRKCRELEKIKKAIGPDALLQIDCFFVFLESRLIGKKGQIKALDVNNFLKSTLDGLAQLLEIDDRFFVSHHVEKISCKKQSEEQVIIKINKAQLQTLDQAII